MSTPSHQPAYTILPLSLPPHPAFRAPATHHLYLRPHAPPAPDADADAARSLFVANLPVDATEAALRRLFGMEGVGGGVVERVAFEGRRGSGSGSGGGRAGLGRGDGAAEGERSGKRKRRRRADEDGGEGEGEVRGAELPATWDREVLRAGSCGVVVFVDRASMQAAVKACRRVAKGRGSVGWKGGEGLGVERYHTHHTLVYPSKPALQSSINAFLAAFARSEAARARLLKRQRSEPDEDGFVTVTRGGRVGPARLEEAQRAAERAKERERGRVGEDFYRFQVREKRKERERDVRKGFEEDRRRVMEMRKGRGKVRPE